MTLNLQCTAHNKCYLIHNCILKSLRVSEVTVSYIRLFGDPKLAPALSATWQRIPDPDGWTCNKVKMKPGVRQQIHSRLPVLKVPNVTLLNFCATRRQRCTRFLQDLFWEASIPPTGKERHSNNEEKKNNRSSKVNYYIQPLWNNVMGEK